jgi:alkylation response protein AidB-like acyl-CoA dehydrogenase
VGDSTPHRPTLGRHVFSFGELVFTDCRIPIGNLLGAVGEGLAVAYSSSILYGRPNLTAVALRVHQATLGFRGKRGKQVNQRPAGRFVPGADLMVSAVPVMFICEV